MKNHTLILIFFCSNYFVCEAQKSDATWQTVDKFVQDYMHFSRLGPGYSRKISQEIIDQYGALFEKDAFLYWDLYKSASDSLQPPLLLSEYVNLARKLYEPNQPLLDYPGMKITVQTDGKHAVVYLKKTNQIMDAADKSMYRNKIKLRIDVNLNREKPLIQNIAEDKRLPFFSSIILSFNYIAFSNVVAALAGNPVILTGPGEQYKELTITAGTSFQAGALLEMRVNRDTREGLLFSAGIIYSRVPLSSTMQGYSNRFPDTLDVNTGNPFACTTSERSPGVTEEMVVRKVELPLLLKAYLNNWFFLKGGIAVGYVTVTDDVNYELTRAGGGLVTFLNTHNQYYLDEDHQLEQKKYGYYRNKNFHFPKEAFLDKMTLSIQLAAGFEKKINDFSFGLEPNISFGMNPLVTRSMPDNYRLGTVSTFHSVFESVRMPAFEFSFGIRLLVSYLFKY
ncbi:MAG: hypothetical protein NT040_03565 [Bacteroidetes bacterium]|nr:hypothetical protein [Bacteroidota bacterium]